MIDGGRTGEILCLGVIKNSSGYIKQVSLSFEFIAIEGEDLKFDKNGNAIPQYELKRKM